MADSFTPSGQGKRPKPGMGRISKTEPLDDPFKPTVDAILQIITAQHPQALENTVNLGPSDTSRIVAERRTIIARLRLRGVRNQSYIAEALGVSLQTVNNDFRALDRTFQTQAITDTQTEKGIDLLRIESAIQAIMPGVELGSLPVIRELVNLLARKAKLLGLDAPVQLQTINWRQEFESRGVDAGSVFDQVVLTVAGMIAAPVQTLEQDGDEEEQP